MTKHFTRSPLLFVAGLALIFTLGVSNSFAAGWSDGTQHANGYKGPGPAIVTVEQAKSMRDDARVALKGYIIQSLGDKDYLFKDETGTITVEISPKRWQGLSIGPNDLVELHGKVDKDWSEVEIDVKQVIKR